MVEFGREALAVYDYGPPPGRSLGDVVLLHGMTDVARSLEPLADSLRDRYRVVLYDARGHGHSSHPGAYSVLHHVADLHALLDWLDLTEPILVGHSLGGHTVANLAGLFPDRVRAVVLLEGMGPPAQMRSPEAAERLGQTRTMVESLATSRPPRPLADLDAAAERLLAAHGRLSRERARVLAAEGTRPGPDGGLVWRHDDRTWHWVTSIDQVALEERWAAITAPILAVSGAEAWDTWWATPRGPNRLRIRMSDSEFAERLALFADIEHIELAEAGHMVHFDQPGRISELVADFLQRRLEAPPT